MNNPKLNFLEIMNETTFLILCYFSFCFTDFVGSIDLRYLLGWIFLGFVGVNMGINFIMIIYTSVREGQLKIR